MAKLLLKGGRVVDPANGRDGVFDVLVDGDRVARVGRDLRADDGTTVIENAAREPEVDDLAHCLVSMGARIDGIGTGVLTVEGVDELRPFSHAPIADRIEIAARAVGTLGAFASTIASHASFVRSQRLSRSIA